MSARRGVGVCTTPGGCPPDTRSGHRDPWCPPVRNTSRRYGCRPRDTARHALRHHPRQTRPRHALDDRRVHHRVRRDSSRKRAVDPPDRRQPAASMRSLPAGLPPVQGTPNPILSLASIITRPSSLSETNNPPLVRSRTSSFTVFPSWGAPRAGGRCTGCGGVGVSLTAGSGNESPGAHRSGCLSQTRRHRWRHARHAVRFHPASSASTSSSSPRRPPVELPSCMVKA